MLGFADLLQAEAFGPLGHERYRSYASYMLSCGHELLRATESTLAMAELLASPERGALVAVDLAVMFEKAWATASTNSEKTAPPITFNIPPFTRVRADALTLRQSLRTLLGAAISHGQNGGAVAVDVERVDASIRVRITANSPGCPEAGRNDRLRPSKRLGYRGRNADLPVAPPTGTSRYIELDCSTEVPNTWVVTLAMEIAAQTDLFDDISSANNSGLPMATSERLSRASGYPAAPLVPRDGAIRAI